MNRRAIACLSALLIVFQMVVAPFVSAVAHGATGDACAHAGALDPWHAGGGGNEHPDRGHAGHAPHHAALGHRCHCAHSVAQTPIVGELIAVAAPHSESESIAARLSGPAFAAPLFDFLRPPD